MPTRIDEALFEAAKASGELHSRSAAQQLTHWARLGRELELAPAVTQDAITRVLAGQATYDSLPDTAQAVVRVEWEKRLASSLEGADRAQRLRAEGRPWAEADEEGNLVMRDRANLSD